MLLLDLCEWTYALAPSRSESKLVKQFAIWMHLNFQMNSYNSIYTS